MGLPFHVIEAPQRSSEWFAARAGRLTGSVAAAMLATVKKGEATDRRDLRLRLACERLTGASQDEGGYVSKEMQRGIDREADAIAAYEAATGRIVFRSGFLSHPELMAGCSIDGDVGPGRFRGIVEAKCPKSTTHLRYLQGAGIPPEHIPQIRHNLWITGAEWCDFVSFDDRFPAALALLIVRVCRAELKIPDYELVARFFLGEVDREVAAVGAMLRNPPEAAAFALRIVSRGAEALG